MVSEEEFDAAFARISGGGNTFYADPACQQAGQIYRSRGGRGTYFRDPDGHLMEILTPDRLSRGPGARRRPGRLGGGVGLWPR